ncbi:MULTISPECIES: hypothetical protein [Clostridium]|uniref:hypothetical protein n=1 Tax=Clostridium sp. 3-3 TaxID=2070757 RepID=UPI000CDB868F|nr:hypothetical protein [Clostridium sp. 3-3]POO86834.1 hypothetical protein C1H59_08710 [Clostridium sp. 3-3]
MIINTNLSPIIKNFMMNDINKVINKYNNMEEEQVQKIENLISKVEDEEIRKELLSDFEQTLEISMEIESANVDNLIIKTYLWIKNNCDVDININRLVRVFEEVEADGYGFIDDNKVIYKMNSGLENLEREKLEYLLETESFISNTFDKDTLVDMWINKTTKEEIQEELIREVDADEILNMKSELMFDTENDEYMYAEIDC